MARTLARKYRTPATVLAGYPALLREPRKCDIFGTDLHFLSKLDILVPRDAATTLFPQGHPVCTCSPPPGEEALLASLS